MNVGSMKKVKQTDRNTLRSEYRREDLGRGVRGKYYKQYMAGTNLVLLDPDVSSAFPTAESVNSALRKMISAAKHVNVPSKSTSISRHAKGGRAS